ncbi:DUF4333 domain-containing protein [Leptolyngbya sp. FACHB-321]|uniref:DUF4333 domain-containing protein n=1 Tax=Leptolyngbya sp. FACHB-321 TaxID=2692807 RepID=UPI001A7E224E|nr:DUF4333 domain-containing protein [Leptolyngbya sp. FACHB-321]
MPTKADQSHSGTAATLQPFAIGVKNVFVLLSACVLGLVGCTKPLDHLQIENNIRDSVIQQGGVSLKTVSCPNDVQPAANQAFTCLGTLDTGGTFAIKVQQKDSQGTVQWDIPSVRGLVNVAKLETLLQETLTSEIRTALRVECGDSYRAVRPGETFDCNVQSAAKPLAATSTEGTISKLSNAALTPAARATKPITPERITVTMDAEGNVNWQEILPKPPTVKVARAAQVTATPTEKAQVKRRVSATSKTVPNPQRPSDSEVVVE